MPLTDARLRTLKYEVGKPIRVTDSLGLCIFLKPNGARLWQFRYRFNGKPNTKSFGAYPKVGLAEARRLRDAARELLDAGIDPGAKGEAEEAKPLFKTYAAGWVEANSDKWDEDYRARILARLNNDLLPEVGGIPMNEVKPSDILKPVRAVEDRGAIETAQRLLRYASGIMRFAVAEGAIERDITVDLKGALRTKPPVVHRKALKASELPTFYERLVAEPLDPLTKLAIELLILTVPRTDEHRFARIGEFEALDGPEPLWRVPAARMKLKREHLIPLAPQAVALVLKIREHSGGSDLLFPADTVSGVISENTMLYALYRMGYHSRATIHGFRGTFSTVLNEHEWNRDWIEMQLAHVQGNVRRAYNAALYLKGRREMMNWWADYIDRQREVADLLG